MKKITVNYANYDVDRELYLNVLMPSGTGKQIIAVKALKAVPQGYIPVAEIEYDESKSLDDNLENAYKIMQNGVVTDSWTLFPPDGLNALVDPIMHDGQAYGHRSASMGDIFVVDDKEYVVATFGFDEVK